VLHGCYFKVDADCAKILTRTRAHIVCTQRKKTWYVSRSRASWWMKAVFFFPFVSLFCIPAWCVLLRGLCVRYQNRRTADTHANNYTHKVSLKVKKKYSQKRCLVCCLCAG
jgi:hypothetical protein